MNDVLYHFTSLGTFNAIIATGEFKLFDVSKSNDPLECVFHIEALKAAYKKMYFKGDVDKEQHLKMHQRFRQIEGDLTCFDRSSSVIMTASFCTINHELLKWRSYGDNGKGVAIGFGRKTLEDLDNNEKFYFRKIEYLSSKEINEKAISVWESFLENDNNPLENYLFDGYFWKEKANSDEEEYRLLSKFELNDFMSPGIVNEVDKDINLMICGDKIKIYRIININEKINGNDFINNIILGPNCDATATEINLLANKNELSFHSVIRSEIQMR